MLINVDVNNDNAAGPDGRVIRVLETAGKDSKSRFGGLL